MNNERLEPPQGSLSRFCGLSFSPSGPEVQAPCFNFNVLKNSHAVCAFQVPTAQAPSPELRAEAPACLCPHFLPPGSSGEGPPPRSSWIVSFFIVTQHFDLAWVYSSSQLTQGFGRTQKVGWVCCFKVSQQGPLSVNFPIVLFIFGGGEGRRGCLPGISLCLLIGSLELFPSGLFAYIFFNVGF